MSFRVVSNDRVCLLASGIAQIDSEPSFENEEEIVGLGMGVPDDSPGLLGELGELLREVDRGRGGSETED